VKSEVWTAVARGTSFTTKYASSTPWISALATMKPMTVRLALVPVFTAGL